MLSIACLPLAAMLPFLMTSPYSQFWWWPGLLIVDFCGKSSGFADFENTVSLRWIVHQLWRLWSLARIPDCASLDAQILGPKRNLDCTSFFSLVPILSFFERGSFKFGSDCYWNCAVLQSSSMLLLHCLCEITGNNGIHIYLFGCNLKKNIGESMDLAKQRHESADHFAYPYSAPSYIKLDINGVVRCKYSK